MPDASVLPSRLPSSSSPPLVPKDHHRGSHLPTDLYGEFFFAKDTLDAEGGVQVGFGGMSMLREHVIRGYLSLHATVLCILGAREMICVKNVCTYTSRNAPDS